MEKVLWGGGGGGGWGLHMLYMCFLTAKWDLFLRQRSLSRKLTEKETGVCTVIPTT